jgi:hypothetical protein
MLGVSTKIYSFLQQLAKLVGGQLAVSENSVEQTRSDGLARMDWHNRASAIFVTQEVMAAFNAKNAETHAFEGDNEVGTGNAGIPAHAAMVTRWMPTNSKSCPGTPSTSRHSSMASRTRSMTSSSDRACVWHAGIWGTEAT